jgi:hypothetical protein
MTSLYSTGGYGGCVLLVGMSWKERYKCEWASHETSCETYEAVERQSTLQQTHPILEPPCRQWAVHCGEVKSLIDADSSCEKRIDASNVAAAANSFSGRHATLAAASRVVVWESRRKYALFLHKGRTLLTIYAVQA